MDLRHILCNSKIVGFPFYQQLGRGCLQATSSPGLGFLGKPTETVTLIYLHVIHGCFLAAMAELSRCEGDDKFHRVKSIYYVVLLREKLLTRYTILGIIQTELSNQLHH